MESAILMGVMKQPRDLGINWKPSRSKAKSPIKLKIFCTAVLMICFSQLLLPRIRDCNNCSFNRLISGSMKIPMLLIIEQRYHLIFLRAPEPQQHRLHLEQTPLSLSVQASVLSTRLILSLKLPTGQAFLRRQIR